MLAAHGVRLLANKRLRLNSHGASTRTTFWKVIFPILTPINATVGILRCLWAWNDFLVPLLLIYMFAQRWVISGVMRGSIK